MHYRRKKILFPVGFAILASIILLVFLYVGSKEGVMDKNSSRAIVAGKQASLNNNGKNIPEKKEAKLGTLAVEVPSLLQEKKQGKPKAGQIIFQEENSGSHVGVKKRKNLLIQVTERGGKDIAHDIESRFEFAKDTSDSLFLAKYYYDKMDYAKAEKWALETNRLDNKIEKSWLIFAKSLAKQGKRIESLKVLKAFLEQEDSAKARVLMDKIRRGKQF